MQHHKDEQKIVSKSGIKRFWGVLLLKMGCSMCAVLFITSLFMRIGDSHTALDVIYADFIIAFALLGLNSYEKIKRLTLGGDEK